MPVRFQVQFLRAEMTLFPMFLKLAFRTRGGVRRRKCLVVGAGKISEGKIAGLLAAGAEVIVVAPSATPQIQAWHRARKILWKKKAYDARDFRGVFLVVAATNSPRVHRRIFHDARKQGVLCNVVDVPELCDFYYPAVVRRGHLQIAISTAGASPSLAKRLRRQLEAEFGPAYASWLKELARQREHVRARRIPLDEKNRLLEQQASQAGFAKFLLRSKKKRATARRK